MDLSALFSDDQLALLGCFGALLACGLIAATSFHFGPAGQKQRTDRLRTAGRISPESSKNQTSEERRAA
ncbi:MAG: hypothetical protein R3C20_10040 [Planctomycetaceae bacterium]